MPIVKVHIVWPSDLARLPPNARARITVEDVTRVDEASTVVAESMITDLTLDDEPVAEIQVDAVDPHADLIVRVHVTEGVRRGAGVERGDLVTTESYPVLTGGHGDTVRVRPRRVG
jgi:hypothetical protein